MVIIAVLEVLEYMSCGTKRGRRGVSADSGGDRGTDKPVSIRLVITVDSHLPVEAPLICLKALLSFALGSSSNLAPTLGVLHAAKHEISC